MSITLQNSIWPNAGGTLGENKVAIPDGITTKWPDGDALVGNFVYKDGKLVGFVDIKALVNNETKSTIIPYDCVIINLDNILEDTLTITPGERCKSLTIVYANVVEFLAPKLKELLGETKFELYFENNIKKLIIHTDRISDEMVANLENLLSEVLPQTIETEKYNHHIEVNWQDINRYAECKTLAQMNEVAQSYGFASYKEDLTSDGWWVYPLDNFIGSLVGFFGTHNSGTAELRGADLRLPLFSDVGASALANCKNLEYLRLYAPSVWTNTQSFVTNDVKLTYIDAYMPNIYNLTDWCKGCTSLSHFRFLTPLKGPNPGYCVGIWDGCVLDAESVQNIAANLPEMTQTALTSIGVNAAYENDPLVLEAEEILASKNWDVTWQFNDAPTETSSTFGFGRRIYARTAEVEQPDGSMKRVLVWGHYVTNEEGYETFRSIESAYEYFNLEPPKNA